MQQGKQEESFFLTIEIEMIKKSFILKIAQ